MDIEKNVRFIIFAVLALLPIMFGFLLFDYSSLYDFQIINEFKNTSLIVISAIYTVIAISFRLVIFYSLEFLKDREIKAVISKISFIEVVYVGCIDALIYGAIPILITYFLHGNIIHFFGNSLIVWFSSLVIFIIWFQIFKNKNISNNL